jgi:alginate O-acetyltransferase complex protein AlgI
MIVVMLGWVLFRSNNLSYAIGYIGRMIGLGKPTDVMYTTMFYLGKYEIFIITLSLLLGIGLHQRIAAGRLTPPRIAEVSSMCGTVILFVLASLSVMTSTYNPFIYFRF